MKLVRFYEIDDYVMVVRYCSQIQYLNKIGQVVETGLHSVKIRFADGSLKYAQHEKLELSSRKKYLAQTAKLVKLKVETLAYPLQYDGVDLKVGCQTINKTDLKKIQRFLNKILK